MIQHIFVFGSNLAGRHGKGAALHAKLNYGAEYGVGVGRTGNAYAIPTKDEYLRVLPLEQIKPHIENFLSYVSQNPNLIFLLTPVGTGLAGYSVTQMSELFFPEGNPMPPNLYISSDWGNKLLGHQGQTS